MVLFLWMIRMAAESSKNRDMRVLRDEIEELTTSIKLRHDLLKNKLKDAIYNAYKLKINSSIKEDVIWEWYRVGNEEEKKAENLIVGYQIQFEGLDKLHKVLHKLHNLDNKNIDKIKEQIQKIKYNLFVLDLHLNRMIKKYIPPTNTEPDLFDERIVTQRTHRSRSRSRSPVRTKSQEPRHSSLKRDRNRNGNGNRNRNRTKHHIHFPNNANIHQIEGLGSKNPFNSRVEMTHTSKEIGEMKNIATGQIIDRYISNRVDNNNEAFSKNTEFTKQFKKNAILRYKTHMAEAQKIENEAVPNNKAKEQLKADTLRRYAFKELKSSAIGLLKNDIRRNIKAKQHKNGHS